MIDREDEKLIQKTISTVMIDALEQVVFPRFDSLESRFNTLEDKVDGLTQAVEILDSDMSGVKMRLGIVEKKLDGLINTTLVVRDHEKRLAKIEKAIA